MTPSELVRKVEAAAKAAYGGPQLRDSLQGGFALSTASVKRFFGDLGHSLEQKVAASHPRGSEPGEWPYDGGEWLYDLVWYVEEEGLLLRQSLVLESEWHRGLVIQKSAQVDGDFEKLVQARADLRVWVSCCHNTAISEAHLEACKKQIHKFSGTVTGDTYLFIIYDWSSSTTNVQLYEAA